MIVIRFGGGTRRQETVFPEGSYSPYFLHELAPSGVLFPNMEISQIQELQTSHGEGTLNILTGKYDRYKDIEVARPSGCWRGRSTWIIEDALNATRHWKASGTAGAANTGTPAW